MYNCPNLEEYKGGMHIEEVDYERFNFKQLKSLIFEPHVSSRGITPLISHLSYQLTTLVIKRHYEPMNGKAIALLKLNCPFLTVLKCTVTYDTDALNEVFTFERLTTLKLGAYTNRYSK